MMEASTPVLVPARAGRLPIGLSLVGDERLARMVAGGSERAFATLYERYHQPLYRYCRSILRSDADAQDALQSALAGAFAALTRGQRDAPVRPWLFRIAHNESVSLLRRRRPEVELSEASERSTVSAEARAEERERLALLLADLRELPDRQRGALVMRELSGLSHQEIAIALGTSVATAKQTIFEARRSLMEFVEGRTMVCEDVRRTISDGDRRALRGRRIRAHLRDCSVCAAFAAAIPARAAELRAIAPLPAVAAAGLLAHGVRAGSGHGGGGASGMAAGAAGVAGKTVGATLATKLVAGLTIAATATIGVTAALKHTSGHASHLPPSTQSAPVHASAALRGGNLTSLPPVKLAAQSIAQHRPAELRAQNASAGVGAPSAGRASRGGGRGFGAAGRAAAHPSSATHGRSAAAHTHGASTTGSKRHSAVSHGSKHSSAVTHGAERSSAGTHSSKRRSAASHGAKPTRVVSKGVKRSRSVSHATKRSSAPTATVRRKAPPPRSNRPAVTPGRPAAGKHPKGSTGKS